jgi:hypothetical protein
MSRGKYWVTEPDQIMEPKIGAKGFAARPPKTVIQVLKDTVKKHGDCKAIGWKPFGVENVCFYFSIYFFITFLK